MVQKRNRQVVRRYTDQYNTLPPVTHFERPAELTHCSSFGTDWEQPLFSISMLEKNMKKECNHRKKENPFVHGALSQQAEFTPLKGAKRAI